MRKLLELGKRIAKGPYLVARRLVARIRMPLGVEPKSTAWGFDRGLPLHRYYLEQFLGECVTDIRGRCLEFLDDAYTTRLGGSAVTRLDIMHVDDSNPEATIVADLTGPNDVPADSFDCIVCTHVLNGVFELAPMVAGLHRILKPGGTLLVAVPHVSMNDPAANDIWRFTPHGLSSLLAGSFGAEQVMVRGYGNSLTAAGEIRGLVTDEFSRKQLQYHDPRFAVEICARAVKA